MSEGAIAGNLAAVRERMSAAAERAGRDPASVTLVAVSKTKPASMISEAVAAGAADIGENRVQEARDKYAELGDVCRWHMVGHLQKNKVRQAVAVFHMIHSVDSVELAKEINRRAGERNERQKVLVEVNVGGEGAKWGVAPDRSMDVVEAVAALPNLALCGLMTMPPWTDDPEGARSHFRALRQLRDRLASDLDLALPDLSMGMTHDFEVAIEEGATFIRVGTAIFGERA